MLICILQLKKKTLQGLDQSLINWAIKARRVYT